MKQLTAIDKKSGALVFVVHKHAAARLHYDYSVKTKRTQEEISQAGSGERKDKFNDFITFI